ncbi:hypothetical protein GF358_00550 [Candidatus Woesearchaeota archaeon]|nr:hypothetical protein [Candidatus Woesearchaeota archaeon]
MKCQEFKEFLSMLKNHYINYIIKWFLTREHAEQLNNAFRSYDTKSN